MKRKKSVWKFNSGICPIYKKKHQIIDMFIECKINIKKITLKHIIVKLFNPKVKKTGCYGISFYML